VLIAWIHFFANLLIALAVLQLAKSWVLEKNPDSGFGKALSFLC